MNTAHIVLVAAAQLAATYRSASFWVVRASLAPLCNQLQGHTKSLGDCWGGLASGYALTDAGEDASCGLDSQRA